MDKQHAAIAGLLLSVGRFQQSAGHAPATDVTPGLDFAQRHLPPEMMPDLAASLAADHSSRLDDAMLIDLADRLAAGEVRRKQARKALQVRSIFTMLGAESQQPAYWPSQPLDLDRDVLFPGDLLPPQDVRRNLEETWKQFSSDAQRLGTFGADAGTLTNELFNLLARYGWSIPVTDYENSEDISLFDHGRVTAAIAACLSELTSTSLAELAHAESGEGWDDTVPVAVLMEGDLSGVQKFIYTITSRGATSALRGRSFYLQMLTDAIARYVLRRFDLPISNLLYAGGGHFYLLLPANAKDSLTQIQADLDQLLLEKHEGELYCALGATVLTCADFQSDRFSSAWRRAGAAVSERKRRRFAEAGKTVFDVMGFGGDDTFACQVCHYEGEDVTESERDESDTATVRKCELCRSLEELGRDLRDASAILMAEIEPTTTSERTWTAILRALGLSVAIRRPSLGWTTMPSRPHRAVLFGLQGLVEATLVGETEARLRCPVARGLRWTVNVSPLRSDGRRATFEDLQNAARGLKRLGVLRMDVDNLGTLFGEGIQRRDTASGETLRIATLSRVAGLSSALSRYFEGWVGVLCQETNTAARLETGEEVIYSIYSGGDDLFIVGAWSYLPDLAHRIREEFGRYVSRHPSLTISGGITIHGGKEPLYQAAESAGDALETSKLFDGKDALTFLGQTLHWGEFPQVIELQTRLEKYLEMAGGNRSLLQILLDAYSQHRIRQEELRQQGIGRTWDGAPQIVWGPYMWRTLYLLRRLADRPQTPKAEVEELIEQLRHENFAGVVSLGLAARWTEALTRKTIDQDEERE